MIKIRYRDPQELSPGLHAVAERHGRTTTVYLLPGLTAAQRRAALRRLRMSAARGYAPRLPTPQLAVALLADRVRTTVAQAGAVFRSHPAGSTVPVMVVSAGAIAFLALSAVSIQVIHPPRNQGRPSLAGAAASGIPLNAGPGSGGTSPPGGGASGPNQAGAAGGQVSGQPAVGSPPGAGVPGRAGSGGHGGSGGVGSSQGSNGGTTLSGSAAPSPAPGGSTTAPAAGSSSAAATPAAPTASATPTPSASKSSACLNVGPLGICL